MRGCPTRRALRVVGELVKRRVKVVGHPETPFRDAKFTLTWAGGNIREVNRSLPMPVRNVDVDVLATQHCFYEITQTDFRLFDCHTDHGGHLHHLCADTSIHLSERSRPEPPDYPCRPARRFSMASWEALWPG